MVEKISFFLVVLEKMPYWCCGVVIFFLLRSFYVVKWLLVHCKIVVSSLLCRVQVASKSQLGCVFGLRIVVF